MLILQFLQIYLIKKENDGLVEKNLSVSSF